MRKSVILLAAVGSAFAASVASADVLAQIQVIATDADTGAAIGEHTWTLPSTLNGGASWGSLTGENSSPWILGNGVAVHGVSFGWLADPQVTANFNVAAGISNTTFTVNSSFLSFGTINPAVGYATAAIGITDSSFAGDIGSITLTGLQPGARAFSARYNGSSQTFADLIAGGSFSVAPGGSQALTGNNASFPGYDPVPGGSASDMQSQFKFSLSRFDRAVGTSTFEIVPAPGAAALLGLGGLIIGRRRRA